MSEIEEQLRIDGFQELGVSESGPCCEGDEGSGYICSWSVDKPIFPSPDFGELDLDTKLEGTALGSLTETSKTGEMPIGENGEVGDLSSLAAGGVGGVAQMLMSMVYPDLKIMFEASTRRVTVSVMWKEGGGDHDLTVMQWVTQPQKGAPPTGGEEDLSGLVPGGGESPASPKAPGNAKTPALGKNPMGGR
jgi:general secretion pathway protein I